MLQPQQRHNNGKKIKKRESNKRENSREKKFINDVKQLSSLLPTWGFWI
jgi:hypothetical protein